mgnify:CR=1 FL=1
MRLVYYIFLLFISFELLASSSSDKLTSTPIHVIQDQEYHVELINNKILNWTILQDPLNNSIQVEKWEGFDKNNSELLHISNASYVYSKILDGELVIFFLEDQELILEKPFHNYKKTICDLDRNENSKKDFVFANDKYHLLLNSQLITLDEDFNLIEIIDNVIDLVITYNNTFAYLIENPNDYLLRINVGFFDSELRFEPSQKAELRAFGDSLVLINAFNDNSLLNFVDPESGLLFKKWINSSPELIDLYRVKDEIQIVYTIDDRIFRGSINEDQLPGRSLDFIPSRIKIFDNRFYIVSSSKVNIYDEDLSPLSIVEVAKSAEIINIEKVFQDHFLIKTKSAIELTSIKSNPQWFVNYLIANYLLVALYFILVILLFYLIRQLRIKNSLLRTLIDLPSSGIVLRLGKSGELMTINSLGRKFLKMSNKVPIGSYFESYMTGEEYSEMHGLLTKAIRIKEDFSQKISILFDRNVYDLFCTITCVRNPAGFFEGLILTAVDITEELERKRMANWAQLAHDMQTNLATIKLNAEQLELEEESINSGRRKKIVHQVNLLINKVRDIVTVGRSDKINRMNHMSAEIINEIVNEFDTELFEKVKLGSEYDNFTISCDKQKLIRAMRNAVENAMKAVNDAGGNVTVKAYRDNRFAYFSVLDDGRGMDDRTKRNMLNPFFTTANKKGGSGIGSMIMQNVAEQHGGELIIKSKINEGTEVIFKIPNYRN